MKALVLESIGAPFTVKETSRPIPAAGEVLVRIHASGINPLDTKIRAGKAPHAKQPLPAVLGMDLAGTVEVLGNGVTNFRVGDEVFGMTGGVGGIQGTLAEFASVDARLLALKPSTLSMREAASLPLIFITAWEGLVDRVGVSADQKLLVLGGGGVGDMAVQIGRSRGLDVCITTRAARADYMRGLGAVALDQTFMTVDEIVSQYTDGEGFDVVYDTLGGSSLDSAFTLVRRFGHVVSCLGWGAHSLSTLSFKAATYSGVFTLLPLLTGEGRAHHGEILKSAGALAERGKLKPLIDSRKFTLETADQAYELIDAKQAEGKLVIDIL